MNKDTQQQQGKQQPMTHEAAERIQQAQGHMKESAAEKGQGFADRAKAAAEKNFPSGSHRK